MFQTVCLRWLTAGLTESAWDAAVACTMPGGNMPGAAIPCAYSRCWGGRSRMFRLIRTPGPGGLAPAGAVPSCGSSGCGWCLTEVGGELGAVAGDPVMSVANRAGCAAVAQAGHCGVAAGRFGLDAAPAPVLPPQDRVQQAVAAWQAVGVANQPHPPTGGGRFSYAGAKVKVLPAHVGDVVDPGAGSGDIPVDERHWHQSRATVPVHGVLG